MSRDIRKIIVHHSAADAPAPQFDAINEWHKARGFPLSTLGFHVGYHWVIEKDGTVVQARDEDEIGAHDQGENLDSIGICLVGNFDKTDPTTAQEESLGKILVRMLDEYGLTIWSIEPHRKNDATSCYGTRLPDHWASKVALERIFDDTEFLCGL